MSDRKPPRQYTSTDSFIVEWWSRILCLRQFISPHWWLVKLIPSLEGSYRFVDSWVLGHFLGSIFLFLATSAQTLRGIEWLAVRYGGFIVIEGFFYEVDLLLFGGYRKAKKGKWYRVLSHRRLVLTSLLKYVSMVFWFAIFYRHWASGFTTAVADQPLTWLTLSFYTMTNFGASSIAPTQTWTALLTLAQSAIGVSMALLIVVSFVRLLPEPGSKTRFEQKPPPYRPVYDPGAKRDTLTSRRSSVMSSVTKESLALAAGVGAFALGGVSFVLSYLLLASVGAHTCCLTAPNCLGGGMFMLIGVGLTSYGLYWLRRKSGPQELEQRRDP